MKAETDSPSVSFNIAGKTFFGGRSHHHSEGNSSLPPISSMRRRSSCAENLSESNKLSGGGDSYGITSSVSSNVISSGENGPKKQVKRHPKHMKSQYSMDSFFIMQFHL
uniref:SYBU n=1 Tax=Panagrellus redivivus TaxID=6233 RepID=A0A7E5A0D4_PANRE